MQKVVIINQPLGNRGDQAAHKALVTLLSKQKDLDVHSVFMAAEDKVIPFIENISDVNYHILPPLHRKIRKKLFFLFCLPPIFLKFLELFPSIRNYNRIIRDANYIICAPGGICMGGYQNWEHIWNLYNALIWGKKVGIFGRSIGPFRDETFKDRVFKKRSLEILRKVDFLSLRDSFSQEIAKAYNIKFIPTIDTAFAVKPEENLPNALLYLKKLRYVVFVPNQLYSWHYSFKDVPPEKMDEFYKRIIQEILKREFRVLMLPQLFSGKKRDYDYFKKLSNELGDERIILIEDCYSSDIQQNIVKNASFLIGCRYHSIVFSIINQTPFISLSYEHKMKYMLTTLDLDKYSLDLLEIKREDFNIDSITQQIDFIVNNKSEIVKDLERAFYKAQKILTSSFDIFMNRVFKS